MGGTTVNEPNEPNQPVKFGRLAGIDYGTVRVGIAICNEDRTMAFPYEVYTRRNPKLDADYFRRFAKEERIVQFVVGLPLHCDGRAGDSAQGAREFGAWLSELTGLPAVYIDERFTSVEAGELLREANLTNKKRKKRLDAVAAQILLTNYIERGQVGTDQNEALED